MKRVMSAPVGAVRASQQQVSTSSSGAAAIGTAAYHPRSPNVALDPVRHVPPLLFLCRVVWGFPPNNTVCQFQSAGGGQRGSASGGASIFGKVPGSAQGIRERSGTGAAAVGSGRGR